MTRKLHPKESLRENARPAILNRLSTVLERAGSLDDPTAVMELHQLRIEVKRLRYALEIFEPCLSGSKPILRTLSDLQEALGAIHDLDVLADILRQRLATLDRQVESEAIEIMSLDRSAREKSSLLQGRLFSQARDPHRLGLIGLLGDKIGERKVLFADARRRWGAGGLEVLARQVRALVAPATATPEPAGITEVRERAGQEAHSLRPLPEQVNEAGTGGDA